MCLRGGRRFGRCLGRHGHPHDRSRDDDEVGHRLVPRGGAELGPTGVPGSCELRSPRPQDRHHRPGNTEDRVAGLAPPGQVREGSRSARATSIPTSTQPPSRSRPGVLLKGALICCTSRSARGSVWGRSSTGRWSTDSRILRRVICGSPNTPPTESPMLPNSCGLGTVPSTAAAGKGWRRVPQEHDDPRSGHRPTSSRPTRSCWRASTSPLVS